MAKSNIEKSIDQKPEAGYKDEGTLIFLEYLFKTM